MSTEWQINRIGMLDFWYYDEQEFEFLDGRMLLRGANGSGKSVTMQSFIPLLLDGNMRPERLDPFGSRARKMENYLLEEGDGREERTGYLYMELKREDSDSYTTIGMGIRARRNKKLDTWYFCVTDGRRVGRNLFLYKDMQNRITCTKQELKNRLGEGGRVMETQGEYVQCVNRLLFGFETMEEYQEMLDLLIQLRTPKLSKDFKPTIINEILSSSLQTLSEEDLRPMSEAIENMDGQKASLDVLDESIRAAEQIEKSFDQYNQIVLYDKALYFIKCAQECRKQQEKMEELVSRQAQSAACLEKEKEAYEGLKREEEVLRQEQDSLKDSDAAQLKEREIRLSGQIGEAEQEVSQKKRQEQEKEQKYREMDGARKRQQEQNELLWQEVEENLARMEEVLEGIPFDEYLFLKNELLEAPREEQAFQSHEKLLTEYTGRVGKAREALLEEKNCQERYDRNLRELDAVRGRQEQKERECRQQDLMLQGKKDQWIENFYLWEKQNQQLHLPEEVKQHTVQGIERYIHGTDFNEIRALWRAAFEAVEQELKEVLFEEGRRRQTLLQELQRIRQELQEWRDRKDPEPECSPETLRSRQLLAEKKIPYLQFYKAVDFGEGLEEKQASRLEEALLAMGILDALIVPARYRETIEALGEGVCDRYIFGDAAQVKQNLLAFLEADRGEEDVSHILASIGVCRKGMSPEGADTWVDERGHYRIGVLEGTVTGEYRARYVGARARERFRGEKIARLEQEEQETLQQKQACEEGIEALKTRKALLQKEWDGYPPEAEIKEAAREYADRLYDLEQLNRQIRESREHLAQVKQELDEIQLGVRELCDRCYLAPRLDLCTQALESLGEYRECFTQVRLDHGKYRSGLHLLESLESTMEAVDQDLDTIRYELGRISRRKSDLEAALQSVREQLLLTDYEKIKERLDYCLERLTALPGLREESARQQTHWREREEQLGRELLQQREAHQENTLRYRYLEEGFRGEYNLGYVERTFAVNQDMEDQAEKVCSMLGGKFGSRKQSDLLGNLQEIYHQNRGYLVNYQLTLQPLFEQEDQGSFHQVSMRRIDICGKYRGSGVRFKELVGKLREDAEVLRRLLSDKERELFEDILANTISKKIRAKIHASKRWVENMNRLMGSMHTSSGLKLSLSWKNRRASREEQLDTGELVELLSKDAEIMREEEVEKLSLHFRSKIAEARKLTGEGDSVQSFHAIMREVLDYRKWFEFTLECQKTGEKKKELTDRVFFTFSGGEKAMSMYVPLFSAVVAKYAGARKEAPRLISLDEAFAGVDETNIRDMFRLMVECRFNFMINSQVLWGDYDTVPGLAIYQLLRPENAKFVTVIPYVWNGRERLLAQEGSR